ncbi:MAG: hypothetical protein M1541_09990 [Acidobacteria bacterium]|nr:hypothetical protein [Acidobacteriota bacterium]
MRSSPLLVVARTATLAVAVSISGQSAERYVGTVEKLETSPSAISIQLDGGGRKWVAVLPETVVLRVAPGEKNLAAAARLDFEELRTGDRILVRAEGEPPVASQVLVLTLQDLAQKQKAERDDWKNRGVSGRVLRVDSQNGEVMIAAAGDLSSAPVVIRISARTEQRRYRSDSARFADAPPSSFADIREGDQLQALGDRMPDGRTVAALKVISGAFRNFSATVGEVNAATQELGVKPAAGGPMVIVKIAPGAVLRKLTPEAAARLAGLKPVRAGASGPQNSLEGSLSLTVSDLRLGDAVVIATLNGTVEVSGTTVTAVAVISGVEPLLKRSVEAQREVLGSWNLTLDPEVSGDRGGQQ